MWQIMNIQKQTNEDWIDYAQRAEQTHFHADKTKAPSANVCDVHWAHLATSAQVASTVGGGPTTAPQRGSCADAPGTAHTGAQRPRIS